MYLAVALFACRLYTKDFFYPVVSIFTALLVAPRFRKSLQSASVYEFLETRFGLECRLFGAATYVVSQLLKLCTTLYLMAVPISMLLGAPLPVVIVFTGVFVTAYSMAGGISAVVYTDVLQVSYNFAFSSYPRTLNKEKERKEKTTPFGVNLKRSQVLYQVAQGLKVVFGCTSPPCQRRILTQS